MEYYTKFLENNGNKYSLTNKYCIKQFLIFKKKKINLKDYFKQNFLIPKKNLD